MPEEKEEVKMPEDLTEQEPCKRLQVSFNEPLEEE